MNGPWGRWIKFYSTGIAIVGSGVLLFKYTTPTDEELISRFSPELKLQYEREKNLRRAEQQELINNVKKTASSNDPIWKTGSVKSPLERNSSTPQNLDQFQKVKASQLQKQDLEIIGQELNEIRQKDEERTKNTVKSKGFWTLWN